MYWFVEAAMLPCHLYYSAQDGIMFMYVCLYME